MKLADEVKTKWEYSALGYSEIIKDELKSFRVKEWVKLIEKQVENKKALKILDIGCGPGFFSIILSKNGHNVIGIDCCENMIKEANKNAQNENVSPLFIQMDSHELDFEDNTFDLIISRNVTWTLADPIKAYTEWKRVLKQNGKLLIFDANWNLDKYDENLKIENERRKNECLAKYGSIYDSYDGPEECKVVSKLPLEDKLRPQWDEVALSQIGFKNLVMERDITDIVWDEKEKLLYGATPMFMISCKKTVDDNPRSFEELTEDIQKYWTKRSTSYSEGNNRELQSNKKDIWTEVILENVEKQGKLKILDVGCGPGEFSILMAKECHDVVGVDLTEAMLDEARKNAQKYNVYVDFRQMDIQNLSFPDNTFDLIISRNVTWNLQNVESFYKGCSRVLKDDGRLIYFDANYYLYLHDEKARIEKEKSDKKFQEIYKEKADHSSGNISLTNVAYDLPMSKVNRPDWDEKNLPNYNLNIVKIDRNINKRVFNEREQISYLSMPMFTVVAEKNIKSSY